MANAGDFRPRRLKGLSEGRPRSDGNGLAFRIDMTDGSHTDVDCDTAEIGDIMAYLTAIAAAGAASRPPIDLGPSQTQNYLAPIPAQGIGFQISDDPEQTLLVIRLAGLDLAFRVPSSGLARLAPDLARIGLTLSADKSRAN
jgi:hypothetical protein